MILLSLCNYLFDKRMIRRFHADPRIESVELLLQEQTPGNAPTEHPRHQQVDSMRPSANIPLDPWQRFARCALYAGPCLIKWKIQSADQRRGLRVQPLG